MSQPSSRILAAGLVLGLTFVLSTCGGTEVAPVAPADDASIEGADAGSEADAASSLPDAAEPRDAAAVPDAGEVVDAGDLLDASGPGDDAGAVSDHTLILGGIAHRPGNTDPLDNCTACHGSSLQGGTGPSCYLCHDSSDHAVSRRGTMHRTGTTSSCATCHGPSNTGGLGPACSTCH